MTEVLKPALLTYVERIELIRDGMARIQAAAEPVTADLLDRERVFSVLGGNEPQKSLHTKFLLPGACIHLETYLRPNGPAAVRVTLMHVQGQGTVPEPDPLHTLASALCTVELTEEARRMIDEAVEWCHQALD